MEATATINTTEFENVTSSESNEYTSSNDSQLVRNALRLYGSIYLVCLVLFAILRKYHNRLFNIRSWAPLYECDMAKRPYNWINWLWDVFRVPDEDILEQCGMDAVCFIRAIRFGRNLALMGCFNALWLLPLYGTAPTSSETSYLSDGLVLVTASNVPTGSPRFIGTIVAAYLIFVHAMYLIYYELVWFTKWRHKFVARRVPRNYAVFVSGIPSQYRSSCDLAQYFRSCSSADAVLEAHVAMNIPELENHMIRRETLIRRVEHAKALERLKGKTKHHRKMSFRGVKKVESVAAYLRELKALDTEIRKERRQVFQVNDPRRSLLTRQNFIQLQLDDDTSSDGYGDDMDDELKRIISPKHSTEEQQQQPQLLRVSSTEESMDLRPTIAQYTQNRQGSPVEHANDFNEHRTSARKQEVSFNDCERGLSPLEEVPTSTTEDTQPGEIEEYNRAPRRDNRSSEAIEQAEAVLAQLNHIFSTPLKLSPPASPSYRRRMQTEDAIAGDVGWDAQSQSECGEISIDDIEMLENGSASGDMYEVRSEITDDDYEPPRSLTKGYSMRTLRSGASSNSSNSYFQGAFVAGSKIRHVASSTINTASTSVVRGSRVATQSMELGARSVAKSSRSASLSIAKGSRSAGKSIAKGSRAASNAIVKAAKDSHVDVLLQNAGERGMQGIKTAQNLGSQLVTSAGTVVPLLISKASGSPRDAGFVVFSNLYTTQTALQMIHHPRPYSMAVQEAPNPKDIFWRNVGMPHRARRTGCWLSFAASAVLCVFWSIPTAFISSLTEVNSLKNTLPKLGAFVETHPGFEPVIALIAPLLLLFINEVILPSVLRFFARWEGHISASMLEASLFVKMGCFMIIQTFFVSAISGSVFAEISNMVEDPASILDLLANSLPAQSSYFIQILLTTTFLIQALEYLRVYPLFLAFCRRYIGPNLTEKERSRSYGILSPLEDPPDFWHAETFAQIILYYIVYFVYATIAPVTSFFLLFCFVLLESGYRYHYFHNYPRAADTGGRLWKTFIDFTLASMLIAQLTLIGLLLLKQSFYAGPLVGPLIGTTVLFIIFIKGEHTKVCTYLPTRDCVVLDDRFVHEGASLDFVRGAYLQPALRDELVPPDLEGTDSDRSKLIDPHYESETPQI